MSRVRVALFSAIGGALTGVICWAFLRSLDWVTDTRVAHGWIVWFLPLVGLAVAAIYHYFGGRAKGGTPGVIEQAHTFTHGVPTRMAPMVFGGSVAGHLFGASVGREGAALQMAGSVTDSAARAARLSPSERQILIAASLAGGWGAVYGVPFTGIMFTLQVTRHHRWRALVPAIISAAAGRAVVYALGYDFFRPTVAGPHWTLWLPIAFVIAGIAVGLMARVFVGLLMLLKQRMALALRWPPARTFVGGVATLALMVLVGRDYLGLSGPLVTQSFAGDHIHWWVPLLKMVFTIVALGTGFVGGEVAPLFVMGATLGATLAPGLGTSQPLMAAVGSATVFASAASVALTGIVLTVEQFGWQMLIPALIVGLVARVVAGRPGLYIAQ